MFAEINIWLDVIGWVSVLGIGLVFLGVHIPALIISGRLKERFIRKHWWYLEAMHEPLPEEYANIALQRTWHWINLLTFITFFVTGTYIRYPFFDGGRELMRNIHLFAAYIAVINFAVRISWTLTGKDRKNFKFDRSDIKVLIANLKYYLFLAGSYPHEKKFHPVQRATYVVMALLFPIMIYSGAAMVWPGIFAMPFAGLTGGLASATTWMRLTHAAVFRIYVLIFIAHGYLGIMETWPTLKFFWFGIKPDQVIKLHHHGDHHEEAHHDKHSPAHEPILNDNPDEILPADR